MSRKRIFIALGVVVLIAAAGMAYQMLDSSNAAPAVSAGYGVTARDMTLGDPKAPLVLIEYAAPRCPHCALVNAEVIPPLKKDYIDTGKVFYVFRVFPLGAGDGAAEKLARCLPRTKYFTFMDALFRNQPKWDDMYGVTDVRGGLLEQARTAGMTEDQFNRCLADTKEDAAINKVAEDGQAKYNISATPTFILNGNVQPKVATWDLMKPVLDKALAGK